MATSKDESVDKKIEELKVQRASVRGCITRIKTLINSKSDTISATELECRLGILESYWKAILTHQSAIEQLAPDELSNAVVRGELEDLYCDVKAKILSLLPNRNRSSVSEINTSVFNTSTHKPSLPPLKLPQFTGKYSEYPNFIATFNKLVHDDQDKSITEKYSHLRGCLSGPALRAIESLGSSPNTYTQALDLLKRRFDNKYLTFQEHIAELFEFRKVSKGSASQLRHLVDKINSHLSALHTLGSTTDILNSIIIHLVSLKLDSESLERWDEAIDFSKFSTWQDCEQVLSRRCQFLETRERKNPASNSEHHGQAKSTKHPVNRNSTVLKTTKSDGCPICSEFTHSILDCPKYSKLTAMERFEEVKSLSRCINCLSKGHSVRSCTSSRCRVCNRPHHTTLHRFSQTNQDAVKTVTATNKDDLINKSSATVCPAVQDNESTEFKGFVFLATAIVLIKDKGGEYHLARILLDSASQLNFITADLAQKLRLQKRRINADISGIGGISSKVLHEVCTTIKSRTTDFHTDLHMCVLPAITGVQPEVEINIQSWNIPRNLELADPEFYKPRRIDMLLGADKFFQLLSMGQIKLNCHLPTLQKTLLGWIVCGTYNIPPVVHNICNVVSSPEHNYNEDSLNMLVEKFWKIEDVYKPIVESSPEQQACEEFFTKTVHQTDDGRLVVRLPLKSPASVLGNSFDTAQKRLFALERKLHRHPEMKDQYVEFLDEYLQLGHMEKIPLESGETTRYYMPHSCVLRPESSSTKLRVVFDASCSTTSQLSLNDILMVGPTVQNDLFSILFRFRCWRYALTADISKMYRQILMHPEDRDLQCILWRNQTTRLLEAFRLNTVTYGTAAAPYLATRCLNHLADKLTEKFPSACKVVKQDFYVDDLLTGADSEQEVIELKDQLLQILSAGKFELRKWYSNVASLLAEIPLQDQEKTINVNNSEVIKTLGIAWEPKEDHFMFSYKENLHRTVKLTKRKILSELATLFDPLGLLNPIVVKGKIFMQELWLLNLNWDESLPIELHTRWESYLEDLSNVHKIRIPRSIFGGNESVLVEMHGFCDASNRAYGCCIYVRCINDNGCVSTNLLAAKSKVAPSKTVRTLPCLELCGAELLAHLVARVAEIFPKPIHRTYLWTDSKIVLGWISSHPSRWKPFVANRASTVQDLTSHATWRYVPSKSNPADMVSRGATVESLINSFWFKGPAFLLDPAETWPETRLKLNDLPEQRKGKTILSCAVQKSFLESTVYIRSNFSRIRRIFAYILRFLRNSRNKFKGQAVVVDELTAQELQSATGRIVWLIQQSEFTELIAALKDKNPSSIKNTLQSLNPYIDESDLVRVGGRLRNADLPYETKHPLLLPKDNPFTHSYMRYLHHKNFHAGPQALVALSRKEFWIVNARNCARKIVRECVYCFKYKPRLMEQLMGDLPEHRLVGKAAFENVGVDFCGPIWITHKIRGKPPYKTYIAVFVCFLSRGVHLETVSDLTSEAFIATLKRFLGRRRMCKEIFCDNATNFVGGKRLLQEFKEAFFSQDIQSGIKRWCAEESITFHHIPPRSPHFGGLWEAAVKAAKSHLFRSLQNVILTFEELSTVCCQIEGILNSRPICLLSSDPNDEEVLTPAHFWGQAPIRCPLEPDISNHNVNYLQRWKKITFVQQHFWKRWSHEYISILNSRYKWQKAAANVTMGSIVLIHDDNLPPQRWLLGKVVEAFKGKDGLVRVVSLKTKAGILKRSIHKIAPLPLALDEIEDPSAPQGRENVKSGAHICHDS